MLLNANNRQRYCVRVSINVSLFLLNMQCGRGWYLQPQGRGSMGVTLCFLSGRGLIHGSQILMLIFGHLFVLLRVHYMVLVLMLFCSQKYV